MRILSYRDFAPGRFAKSVEKIRAALARGDFAAAGLKKALSEQRQGFVGATGGAATHLALHGRQVLVVTIPDGADFWMPGPVDKRHDTVKNPFGPDDRIFRLNRTNLRQCEDLAFDRQKPLRPHEP
jgi:hypothetical protein